MTTIHRRSFAFCVALLLAIACPGARVDARRARAGQL